VLSPSHSRPASSNSDRRRERCDSNGTRGTGGPASLYNPLTLTTRRSEGSPLHFAAHLAAGAPCAISRRSLWRWRRRRHRKVARLQAG
jgi:hypothetical protein